ncbi:uncharacterized protein PV09_06040 [Verruconis gallopava]|uniref:Uncharacterized protein n=1 Tax=Verruconis gallopava TaxID=253628 RepID=A0A0D2A7R6_9PEZI|nr:uncharacterized protein PV09_06040 [Verruconis gallopava]KIW02590.1 hypothetical protein PV09_06040 [Verruconis gallopava]
MSQKQPYTRKFVIPLSVNEAVTFEIAEPTLRADGLSLQTWTSSYLLARLLPSIPDINPEPAPNGSTIPVLELGAGTGLVGLTANRVWKVNVILTDLAPIAPGLAYNIALNEHALAGSAGHGVRPAVLCGSLDWKQPTRLTLYKDGTFEEHLSPLRKANVILAADTVYSEEHPELLSKAILTWLAPGNASRVVIMYPMRVAYLDQIRELWQRLEEGGLETVREGKEQASEDEGTWDDELLCEWSIWKWRTTQ